MSRAASRAAFAANVANRRNVIYGVYRAGTWFIDTLNTGAPTYTFNFGGLSQDVPLLLPGWNGERTVLARHLS